MFLDNFRAFLAEKHKTDADWPGTLRDFEMRFTSKIVLTSKTDQDGVGRSPWRLAIYVSPDLGRVQEMIKVADAPTMSKRGLLVSLEFEDAGHVNIVWGGDTYLCRAQFDAAAQAE